VNLFGILVWVIPLKMKSFKGMLFKEQSVSFLLPALHRCSFQEFRSNYALEKALRFFDWLWQSFVLSLKHAIKTKNDLEKEKLLLSQKTCYISVSYLLKV
jgi:hypothetical protein